jgi:hypothetical protein
MSDIWQILVDNSDLLMPESPADAILDLDDKDENDALCIRVPSSMVVKKSLGYLSCLLELAGEAQEASRARYVFVTCVPFDGYDRPDDVLCIRELCWLAYKVVKPETMVMYRLGPLIDGLPPGLLQCPRPPCDDPSILAAITEITTTRGEPRCMIVFEAMCLPGSSIPCPSQFKVTLLIDTTHMDERELNDLALVDDDCIHVGTMQLLGYHLRPRSSMAEMQIRGFIRTGTYSVDRHGGLCMITGLPFADGGLFRSSTKAHDEDEPCIFHTTVATSMKMVDVAESSFLSRNWTDDVMFVFTANLEGKNLKVVYFRGDEILDDILWKDDQDTDM